MSDPEDEREEPDSEDAAADKKKGPGVILIGAVAVIICAAAGAGGYFLSPAKGDPGEAGDSADAAARDHAPADNKGKKNKKNKAGDGKKHGKSKSKDHSTDEAEFIGGKFHAYDGLTYFVLDPLIVSIRPIGSAKHLKVSIVLETDPAAEPAIVMNSPRIRDVLNTYLRSVSSEDFEDPAAMSSLRAQLLRRVRAVIGSDLVNNVLITEFILT